MYPSYAGEREHDERLISQLKAAPITWERVSKDEWLAHLAHLTGSVQISSVISWTVSIAGRSGEAPSVPYAKKCVETALVAMANTVIADARKRMGA